MDGGFPGSSGPPSIRGPRDLRMRERWPVEELTTDELEDQRARLENSTTDIGHEGRDLLQQILVELHHRGQAASPKSDTNLEAPIAKHASAPPKPTVTLRPPSVSGSHDLLEGSFSASDDYRSIVFRGPHYTVTLDQATIISTLHKAALSGHPDVSKGKLLAAVERETSRISDIFRGSPLWKTLVISIRKGTYRLNIPAGDKSASTTAR
jgi:hypothetical protein